MLTELAISTVVALAALKVGHSLGKRGCQTNSPAQSLPEDTSIAFSWQTVGVIDGFCCPKCNWITGRISDRKKVPGQIVEPTKTKGWEHPKLCECSEYHKEHFHFECGTCGFKAIMRTADQ